MSILLVCYLFICMSFYLFNLIVCFQSFTNAFQVLNDFPHATSRIPFEYLFDMITPLRPRAFSIASSHLASLLMSSSLSVLLLKVKISEKQCSTYYALLCSIFLLFVGAAVT